MAQVIIDPSLPDYTAVEFQTFADSIMPRIMNEGGRFDPYVITQPIVGSKTTIDQHGGVELLDLNGLYQKISETNVAMDRRLLEWTRQGATIWVDKAKVTEIIEDPTGIYSNLLVSAYQRLKDRVILNAAIGSVKTGETGSTVVTAANDGVLTVDASAGVTYEKMLELSRNFINNSVYGNIAGSPVLTLTGKESEAILKEAEFTNAAVTSKLAYNFSNMVQTDGFLVKKIGEFDVMLMGANSVNGTLPIIPNDATYRYCIAMAPKAITLGIGMAPKLEIVSLPDRYDTVAIKFTCGIGATRNQGEMVQIFKTTK
jgi:hypothetical protein